MFPNPQRMTNIIQWNDNGVCMSDGYLWALENTKWTAASICNTRNERLAMNTRNGLLVMINGTMELFRPSKEACTYNHDMPPIRSVETATHCTSLTIPTPQCKPLNPAKYSQKFIPVKCCTIPDVDAPVESQAISTASTTDDSEPSQCKICLSDDTNITRSAIIPCGHVACSECIGKALTDSKKCPFCRGKVDNLLRLYE